MSSGNSSVSMSLPVSSMEFSEVGGDVVMAKGKGFSYGRVIMDTGGSQMSGWVLPCLRVSGGCRWFSSMGGVMKVLICLHMSGWVLPCLKVSVGCRWFRSSGEILAVLISSTGGSLMSGWELPCLSQSQSEVMESW